MTKLFDIDFETKVCDAIVEDGSVDGTTMVSSYYYPDDPPYARCSLPIKPSGNIYFELHPVNTLDQNISEFDRSPVNLAMDGTTYYLAGFFRMERIGGNAIWAGTGRFDKLFGMRGDNFRWIIGVGWPTCSTYDANKFNLDCGYGRNSGIPDGT